MKDLYAQIISKEPTPTFDFFIDDLRIRLEKFPVVERFFLQGETGLAYDSLVTQISSDSTNPYDWVLLGEVAMAAQQWLPAQTALERAVLINPELAGAWIDLSIIHLQLGNASQAQQYLDYVQQTFSPNEQMASLIKKISTKAEKILREKYRWKYIVSTGIGYDSNANSGLTNSILVLTPVGDRIPLELDPSYRPREDYFGLVGLQARKETPIADSNWTLNYGYVVRQRQFVKETQFSTTELGLQLQGIHPASIESSYWVLGAQAEYVRLGDKNFIGVSRLTVGQEFPLGDCRVMPGVELEERRNFIEPNLSGRTLWGSGQVLCERVGWRWGGDLRLGHDSPIYERSGGQTVRGEVQVYMEKPVSERSLGRLTLGLGVAKDQKGYNPLIDNGSPRHIQRQLVRAEWIERWAGGWEGVIGLEHNLIQSNIALFEQSNILISLIVRRLF